PHGRLLVRRRRGRARALSHRAARVGADRRVRAAPVAVPRLRGLHLPAAHQSPARPADAGAAAPAADLPDPRRPRLDGPGARLGHRHAQPDRRRRPGGHERRAVAPRDAAARRVAAVPRRVREPGRADLRPALDPGSGRMSAVRARWTARLVSSAWLVGALEVAVLQPPRWLAVILWFVLVCRGMAFVRLLELDDAA